MKKLLLLAAAIMMTLALSGVSFAATTMEAWTVSGPTKYPCTQVGAVAGCGSATGGDIAGGIVWSRHNMSSYGAHYQASTVSNSVGGTVAPIIATTEICVFCHTPHFGGSAEGPLWNRTGQTATSFTTYGTTVGGTVASTTVNAGSLSCLSCHDGVTAIDQLVNRPGPGPKTMGSEDQKWYFASVMDTTTGLYGDIVAQPGANGGTRLNIGGATAELSNDHPVSIIYDATKAGLRPSTTSLTSLTMYNAKSLGTGTQYGRSDNIWAINGYLDAGTATIATLLRQTNTTVECVSCHDPHYKNQTNDDPSYLRSASAAAGGPVLTSNNAGLDGMFLRRIGGNSNSGMCRTCHNK